MSVTPFNVETSQRWEAAAEHINDPLAVIYNEGQWSLYKVSPLNNLQYDRVKLKQYASKIRQTLVCSVSAKSSLQYAVQFDILPLKYSEDDANAIKVSVTTTSGTKTKVAYTSILLAWGASSSLEEAVHLPYLLERGERKLGDSVKACLQKLFDCNIKPFSFTQYQLLMFGFSFVDSAPFRSTDAFVLSYTTPQADVKDKLDIKFEVGDIHIMWNGLKEEVNNMSELVSLVYQTLQSQIMHTMMLNVSVLDIYKITMPKAEVKSNGTVKMKTPEVVNSVLKVLNEIIFEDSLIES